MLIARFLLTAVSYGPNQIFLQNSFTFLQIKFTFLQISFDFLPNIDT